MAESSKEAHDGGRAAATAVPPWDFNELLSIRTHLSHGSARTHDVHTCYAVDTKSGGRSSAIIRRMSANRSRGMATSAIWKATYVDIR